MECLITSVSVQAEVDVSDIIKELSDEQKLSVARYCCESVRNYDAKVVAEKKTPKWKSYLVLLPDTTYCIVFGQHKEDVITFLGYKEIDYITFIPYVVPMTMKHIDNLTIYGTQVVRKVLDEIKETKFNAIWDVVIPQEKL